MSDRYKMISAVMDDPLNRACILREMTRRKHDNELLSPAMQSQTGEIGHILLRDCFSIPGPEQLNEFFLFSVFSDGNGFFVVTDEEEVGPFATVDPALCEMVRMAEESGYEVLPTIPWEGLEEDFPMYRRNQKQ